MKKVNIIFVIMLYACQIVTSVAIVEILMDKNKLASITIDISFLLALVCLIFAIARALMGLMVYRKRDVESPYKSTLIIKLSLIPFYIFNFIFWVLIMIGMLNPFLFIFMPLVLFSAIAAAYLYMVSTSIPNVVYAFVHRTDGSAEGVDALIAVTQFIFVADVVGALLLCIRNKEK